MSIFKNFLTNKSITPCFLHLPLKYIVLKTYLHKAVHASHS